MRNYILTPKEKEIIDAYLEQGIKLDGFSVLVHLCRNQQSISTIKEDLETIQKFLQTVDSKS